jgi:hypothetical protein
MANTECMNTTVVNTSGTRRYFDFLPPHGATLNPGQEFTYAGDIPQWIIKRSLRPDQLITHWKTVQYTLQQNLLAIKSTPSPLVYDPTQATTRMIDSDNGKLQLSPPCYVTGGPPPIVVGP